MNIGATPKSKSTPGKIAGTGQEEIGVAVGIVRDFVNYIANQPDNGEEINLSKYMLTAIEAKFENGAIDRARETFAEIRKEFGSPISPSKLLVKPNNPKLSTERLTQVFQIINLFQQVKEEFRLYQVKNGLLSNSPVVIEDIERKIVQPEKKSNIQTPQAVKTLAPARAPVQIPVSPPLRSAVPPSSTPAAPALQVETITDFERELTLELTNITTEELKELYDFFRLQVPELAKRKRDSAEELGPSKLIRTK